MSQPQKRPTDAGYAPGAFTFPQVNRALDKLEQINESLRADDIGHALEAAGQELVRVSRALLALRRVVDASQAIMDTAADTLADDRLGAEVHELMDALTNAAMEARAALADDPSLDVLCCDYKTCPHSCADDDPCSACIGRGDCGDGVQR